MGQGPNRRRVLTGVGALAVVASLAEQVFAPGSANAGGAVAPEGTAGGEESFAFDHVRKLAEELAAREFVRPRVEVAEPFNALTQEQYRDIRFNPEAAIWRNENLGYQVQLLPLGWLYDTPVEIWIVDGGKARSLKADRASFNFGPAIATVPDAAPFAFSGFRISGLINRADSLDDVASFQGASYFKAMGRDQQYGLSARGLAVNTARPGGEEFPIFRAFWIDRPKPGASEIIIYALLDSDSIAGAYRFTVSPGAATTMDVVSVLYPRRSLSHVGLAPLTSMYFFSPAQRRLQGDYRQSVHNSEGLAVVNGRGERLWRPLANPKMLQTSAFVDKDLQGFGLVQRERGFDHFEDLDARFERRPTAWVEPSAGWGDGYVELIEIPISEEIHDNIVAYWKPAKALEPGRSYKYAYRITWGSDIPVAWAGAWVQATRVGQGRNPDNVIFIVDFVGPAVRDLAEMPVAELFASTGSTSNLSVQRHPALQGIRVKFQLSTSGTDLIELRLGLKLADQLISESWLYRWTRA